MISLDFIYRITDKKEKSNGDTTLHHRATAVKPAHQPLVKTNSNPSSKLTRQQVASVSSKERRSSYSDSSTTSTSSRKNSETNSVPDEKPTEPNKTTKDPNTPPIRPKRKTHDHQQHNNNTVKHNLYQEPQEPKIVTEEISDPWERQKAKHEAEEDKHKNKKRTKYNKNQAGHKDMHSTGSSIDDEAHEEKPVPPGFTTIENKTKGNKNKRMEYSGQGNMDRLDEISLNGPRPDAVKENPMKKSNNKTNSNVRRNKKTPFHHEKERMMMDTPTSPHAIAAAIVEAALNKSQQKKKSSGKIGYDVFLSLISLYKESVLA